MFWRAVDIPANLHFAIRAWALLLILALLAMAYFGEVNASQWLRQLNWVSTYKDQIDFVSDVGLYPFYFFFIAIIGYSFWKHNQLGLRVGTAYLLAQALGSFLAVRIIKMTVGRVRPESAAKGLVNDWGVFTWDNALHSFPSGHTADLFTGAFFVAVIFKNKLIGWAAFTCAVIIGLTRIMLGKHYLGDVIMGAFIAGIFSIIIVQFWLLPRVRR